MNNQIKNKKACGNGKIRELKDFQELHIGEYQETVERRLQHWKEQNFIQRLRKKDPTLWFSEEVPEITNRLGWLVLPEIKQRRLDELVYFAEAVKEEGFTEAVLLGMGGSSLAPEVFQKTFGNAKGCPGLCVLDSTHPEAVSLMESKLDLRHTLFLISSKSGTTIETLSLFKYFWNKMSRTTSKPGKNFIAISDEGSPLIEIARDRKFREMFQPPSDVGGRYSALTDFGLVPAALIGMDIHRLLEKGRIASENNASEERASGIILGAALGELGSEKDKLTIIPSQSIAHFPVWLEQLIAESTGKEERGIVPVTGEPFVPASLDGDDRLFVFMLLESDDNKKYMELFNEVQEAGHPAIRIILEDKYDIAQEMYRWELAVASAGSILGIHPFNQPDVQLAKNLAREAMKKGKGQGKHKLPEGKALLIKNTEAVYDAIKSCISSAKPGDYISIQAFLAPSAEKIEALQRVRLALLEKTKLATTLGFGPRFLHSTGQLHKGGPDKGLFIQLVDVPERDLNVPETDYTFGELISAQSLGDYQALIERNRRVIRINMEENALEGLNKIEQIVSS